MATLFSFRWHWNEKGISFKIFFNLFIIFLFHFTMSTEAVFNKGECVKALGMENGDIPDSRLTASSSYEHSTVGPHNARIRKDEGGGAWCPKGFIDKKSEQWLQVDLGSVHVISAIETQGRFGNGLGVEYAEAYRIEYFRPRLSRWVHYRSRNGTEILKANTNTYVSVTNQLSPVIYASKIRIHPHSQQKRTVCLRLELYGCQNNDGLISYSMPQGDRRGSEYEFYDWNYDGEWQGNILRNGIGCLTDGEYGPSNFKLSYYPKERGWVGWKKNHRRLFVELTFEFEQIREFQSVTIYTNNQFELDVSVFQEVRIYLDDVKVDVDFKPKDDFVFEAPRNVGIQLYRKIGKVARIRLYFNRRTRWIMISEVSWDTFPTNNRPLNSAEILMITLPVDRRNISTFKDKFESADVMVVDMGAKETAANKSQSREGQSSTAAIVGTLSAVVIIILITITIIVIRLQLRLRKRMKSIIMSSPNLKDVVYLNGGPEKITLRQSTLISSSASTAVAMSSASPLIQPASLEGFNSSNGTDSSSCCSESRTTGTFASPLTCSTKQQKRRRFQQHQQHERRRLRRQKQQNMPGMKNAWETTPILASKYYASSSPQNNRVTLEKNERNIPEDIYAVPDGHQVDTPYIRLNSSNSVFTTSSFSNWNKSTYDSISPSTRRIRTQDRKSISMLDMSDESGYAIPLKSSDVQYANGNFSRVLPSIKHPNELSLKENRSSQLQHFELAVEVGPIPMTTKDITIRRILSDGVYGGGSTIYIAHCRIKSAFHDQICNKRGVPSNGQMLSAIKFLRDDASEISKSDFIKEAHYLYQLDHPNISRVVGLCCTQTPFFVAMEFLPFGDLNYFLRQNSPTAETASVIISARVQIQMAIQIASAMKYLESLNFVHRDLATRNCLVGESFLIKICDFGREDPIYERDYFFSEKKCFVPIRWMSWEAFLQELYTPKSDVWSFAVCLWEILTYCEKVPHFKLNNLEIISCFKRIEEGEVYGPEEETWLDCPQGCSKEIFGLMEECWRREPASRPTFADICLFLQRTLDYDMSDRDSSNGTVFPRLV